MCGIMGYVGPQQAAPVILDGLRRLEYRGYDSAGIAVTNGHIDVRKAEGKIERLSSLLDREPLKGSVGIGHTRWATHGEPSDVNAHPHTDPSGAFVVVHNGIIENFLTLRESLQEEGHDFTSDTDSEILAHLVATEYDGDLEAAVRLLDGDEEGFDAPACLVGSGELDYEERVAREMAVVESYVQGDDRLYDVPFGDEPGCMRAEVLVVTLAAPWGRWAEFCFDDATGALVSSRVRRPSAVDTESLRVVSDVVTDADFPTADDG